MIPHDDRKPTIEGVLAAARRIAEIVPPTPLLPLEIHGTQCFIKAENLQPVGAFKIRGGWNRLSQIPAEDMARGVVGASSGNHAQGVAWAAKRLGMPATIVMPNDAPAVKADNVRALGATIVPYERLSEDRDAIAASLCEQTGATFVHAYGDSWVIEGQGTAGVEVAAQRAERGLPAPTRFVAPCGGGGLTAGLALACPEAEIIPVEPEGWDDVTRSLIAGEILSVGSNPPSTSCDALQTLATRPINFDILQRRASPGVTVTDRDIREAQRFAFSRLKLVLEPGGAAALAAALAGKVPIDAGTTLILSGGNVDAQGFAAVIGSAD